MKDPQMQSRKELKELYLQKYLLESQIATATEEYLSQLGEARGIFLTDHAIKRYLERVEGHSFDPKLSDTECLKVFGEAPEVVRERILTIAEDREILLKGKSIYHKKNLTFIIKNLAVVSCIVKGD